MEKSIELSRLAIGYRTKSGDRIVASGLEAHLHAGQLTALLGVNGAGKSTLMRTMAGFMKPLSGQIHLLGRSLDSYKEIEIAKRIGVVLTDNCRIAGMTAGELVALGRSPYTGFWGRLQKGDRKLVAEAVERVGIAPLINRELTTLSDGETKSSHRKSPGTADTDHLPRRTDGFPRLSQQDGTVAPLAQPGP